MQFNKTIKLKTALWLLILLVIPIGANERFQQIYDLLKSFCRDGKLDSSCGTNLSSDVYCMV